MSKQAVFTGKEIEWKRSTMVLWAENLGIGSEFNNDDTFHFQWTCQCSKSHFFHILFFRTLNLYGRNRIYMEKAEFFWK